MNEQVRRYFDGIKIDNRLKDAQEEKYYLELREEGTYLHLMVEGVGEGVKLPITDDDLNFIHYVRILFKKKYPSSTESLPAAWRVLAAKYALLHPAPLHHYIAKWDNADNVLKIYETRGVGGGSRKEDHFVAPVNDDMRELYAQVMSKKDLPKDKETDEAVAKWWMEENKECLHEYLTDKLPDPQVKILIRGRTSISLAFRKLSKSAFKKYTWLPVENIHINMNKFRSTVTNHGFNELMHAGAILRITPKKWNEILESDKVMKGVAGKKTHQDLAKPKTREGKIVPVDFKDENNQKSKLKLQQVKDLLASGEATRTDNDDVMWKGKKVAKIYAADFISPGHQEAEERPSQVFKQLYNSNKKFREMVETDIIKSVSMAIPLLTQGGARANIRLKPDMSLSIVTHSIKSDTVENIVGEARQRFLGRTSRISDEDWKNWEEMWDKGLGDKVRSLISGSARTATKRNLGIGRKGGSVGLIATGTGGGDAGERHGGHLDAAASHGDNDRVATVGGGTSDRGDVGPGMSLSRQWEPSDIETPEELLQYLRINTKSIHDPVVRQKISQFAGQNPMIAQIAKGLAGLGNVAPENDDDYSDYDDDDDKEMGTVGRYRGSGVRQEYTFRYYLNKRLNEMGLPWGNDKRSAKIIKPGQTLKGGIQVFGAPWTAGGGPNNKDNDIKIKG